MAWDYSILNKAEEDCLDIGIHDAIGASADGKGISSAMVRDALKGTKAKSIRVNIHSAGGEVLDGLAMYNLLASHPARVTVKVPTLAASIASVIAMAGDEIEMGKGAFMMVHNPYAQTKGGSEDLRRLADVLDKMRDSMVAIYSKRTGKSKSDILALMEAETWMTGEEAVKNGFADKVVASTRQPMAADSLKVYAKVPDELIALLGEGKAPGLTQVQSQVETGDKDMDEKTKKELAEMLDAFEKKMDAKFKPFEKKDKKAGDEDEDEDLPEGKKGKAALEASAEASILGALAEANKMVAQLNAKLEAQSKTAYEARVTEAVEGGKLLPSQKAWALGLEEKTFDAYLAAVGDQVFPVGKEHTEDSKTAVAAAGATELTADEKKLAKSMGISDADLIAYNKANPKTAIKA